MPEVFPPVPPDSRETYSFPRLPLVGFFLSAVLGLKRSVCADSRLVLRANPPLPALIGLENVPADDPFVLVANHYERPGMATHFAGIAINATLLERRPAAPEIRWVITSEWEGRHFGPIRIPVWLTRWVFGRVARIYGFITMPRREERTAERALALRQALAAVSPPEGSRRRAQPIGLMPEGRGKGVLVEALPGSGAFIQMLTRRGAPVLPVGLHEEAGKLVVRFGEPFSLVVDRTGTREEQDAQAREQVMAAIGRLLPEALWGFYSEQVHRSLQP